MAVIYPSDYHTKKLVDYTNALRIGRGGPTNDDRVNSTPVHDAICFTDDDVTLLRRACDNIVAELNKALPFFTAGGVHDEGMNESATTVWTESMDVSALTSTVHSTSSSLDVDDDEHVGDAHFPDGSLAQLLRGRTHSGAAVVPFAFYEKHVSIFAALRTALLANKSALQSINASHAFIWTANVTAIKKYVHMRSRPRHRPLSIHANSEDHTAMRRAHYDSSTPARPAALLTADETATTIPRSDAEQKRHTDCVVNGNDRHNCPTALDPLSLAQCPSTGLVEAQAEGANTELPLVGSVASAVSTELLATLPDDVLPDPSVCQAYAVFIQACDALVDWLNVSMMLSQHADDVPREGSYLVPLEGDASNSSVVESADSATAYVPPLASSFLSPRANTVSVHSAAAPARTSRSRVVHIRRFTVHDVRHIYTTLAQQLALLFESDNTQYNSYIHRNILQPTSLALASDLLSDISNNIQRLEDVADRRVPASVLMEPDMFPYDLYNANLACGAMPVYPYHNYAYTTTADPRTSSASRSSTTPLSRGGRAKTRILFRPSLSSFRALQAGLRVYLGVSITADDHTSLSGYRAMYGEVMGNVHKMMHMLQTLPKPPLVVRACDSSHLHFVHDRPVWSKLSTNMPAENDSADSHNTDDHVSSTQMITTTVAVEDERGLGYACVGRTTAPSVNVKTNSCSDTSPSRSVFLCNEWGSSCTAKEYQGADHDDVTARGVPVTHPVGRSGDMTASAFQHSAAAAAAAVHTPQSVRYWMSTLAERDRIYSGFKLYWSVRESVQRMRSGLAKNIQSKNRTHRTYRAVHAVRTERDAFGIHAEEWYNAHLLFRRESEGIVSAIWRAASSSLRMIGDLLVCKAELGSGGGGYHGDDSCRDEADEKSSMTTTSPFYDEKHALLLDVNRVWDMIEMQGLQLERTYEGLFHRNVKAKWMALLNNLVK